MKHIRPVSIPRAQLFILFGRDLRAAFDALVIAKKNLSEPDPQ